MFVTHFNIVNNRLIFVEKNVFQSCKLQEINFSNNQLSFNNEDEEDFSPFKFCENLIKMDLSYNNISKIYNDWKRNKKLLTLNLRHNQFKQLQ